MLNARTYVYARVSTDEQAKSGAGIDAQIMAIRAYLVFKGDTLPPATEPFIDDGVSGSVSFAERKAGKAIHTGLRSGDHIVVAKLDRLGRSLMDLLHVLRVWREGGIIVHVL